MVSMEIWVYSDEQKTLRQPQLYRAQQNAKLKVFGTVELEQRKRWSSL